MYSAPAALLSVAVVQLCWLAVGAHDGAWTRWAHVPLVLAALATVISFPLRVSFFRWVHYRMLSDQHYIEQRLELAPH